MPEILKPDVCILGAGSVGTSLALKARERGLSVVLVGQGQDEPGDPLHGALHSAALAATARQAQAIRTAARLGLENASPKLNYKIIAEHAEAVAEASAPRSSPERLTALGVQRIDGKPVFSDRSTLSVGDTVVKPGHVILATGSTPATPDLPGLAEIAYFTPQTILGNVRKLTHLLVLGGGETAVELAQIYRRLGSDVTLVPQGALLEGYDKEACAVLRRLMREEGVAVLEQASVKAFLPRSQGIGVSVDDRDGRVSSLDVSHVLLAGARTPQLDWAALEKAQLKRHPNNPDRLQLNEHGRTVHPRISAFGGAAGESNVHLALRSGERLLDRLAGRTSMARKPIALPRIVETDPPMAQIGSASSFEAPAVGANILRASPAENDAARAIGRPEGTAKILVARTGAILGGVMVGHGAGEVISSLALAMSKGMTAKDLANLPVSGTSALAVLTDIGTQFAGQSPVSPWSKRRASLRRLLR